MEWIVVALAGAAAGLLAGVTGLAGGVVVDAGRMAVLVVSGALVAPFGVRLARRLAPPLPRQVMAGALGVSAARLLFA